MVGPRHSRPHRRRFGRPGLLEAAYFVFGFCFAPYRLRACLLQVLRLAFDLSRPQAFSAFASCSARVGGFGLADCGVGNEVEPGVMFPWTAKDEVLVGSNDGGADGLG